MALAIVSSVLAAGSGAARAEDDACAMFKWPLAREQGWFEAQHPVLASGASFEKAEGAATIALSPADKVSFPVASSRKQAAGSFAGLVSAPVEKDGTYQITLSDDAWLDVVQGGKALRFASYSRQQGCKDMRKSFRYRLKAGTVTLQLGGVKAGKIDVAIGTAE